MVGNTQKLDAIVDLKLPNDMDYASIFSKVIGHKLYDGPSRDIYLRCRMNFANNPVQTQYPRFINMGLPAINTLNESDVLDNPDTRILGPVDGSHFSELDHVFSEATAFGMSAAKSDHDYN